jgi:hypothetical protein
VDWSARWCWQARIAIWESEQDQLRREEHKRLVEQQAKEDHALARSVGTGALSVVAEGLSALVNKDDTLRREVTPREVAPLVKAATDCLHFAYGTTPAEAGSNPNAPLEKVLQQAPQDTRTAVLAGLHALLEWSESHAGRRS